MLCLDLQSLPTHVSEAKKSCGHLEVGDEYHILGWVENKDVKLFRSEVCQIVIIIVRFAPILPKHHSFLQT